MGLQTAVHLGHMPWALTKEEEEEVLSQWQTDICLFFCFG
jgi:hypothetical protein